MNYSHSITSETDYFMFLNVRQIKLTICSFFKHMSQLDYEIWKVEKGLLPVHGWLRKRIITLTGTQNIAYHGTLWWRRTICGLTCSHRSSKLIYLIRAIDKILKDKVFYPYLSLTLAWHVSNNIIINLVEQIIKSFLSNLHKLSENKKQRW